MTEPTPMAHGGDSNQDAAKALQASVEGMEASLSKIVDLAKEMRDAFTETSSAANGIGTPGAGSARGAHAGGAGGTGAGRPTAMSNSLAKVSDWGSAKTSQAAMAGAAAVAAGGGGGFLSAIGRGIGGFMKGGGPLGLAAMAITPLVNAAGTMQRLGRVEAERAMEIEWMRTRGARAGSDWDKIYNSNVTAFNVGLDVGEAQQAVGAYQSMGYDRTGSGVNLGESMTIGALTGQSPLEALQSATAHRAPGQIYALQSMGIQVMNPDGSTRGQADLANQLFDRAFGGQNISLEDIKTSFDPQIGYITKMLESAGMDQSQIESMRHLMEARVTTGAPVTQATLDEYTQETMGEGRSAEMRQQYATGRVEQRFAEDTMAAFADATDAVAGLKNAIVDNGLLSGLNSFANYVATANDVFKDAGFTKGQAGLGTGLVGINHLTGGGGNAEGDWQVSGDKVTKIHRDEMVLPSRIAHAVRKELGVGQVGNHTGPSTSSAPANVTINVQVQRASDAEAMAFARRVKTVLSGDAEMSSLGLGQVVT